VCQILADLFLKCDSYWVDNKQKEVGYFLKKSMKLLKDRDAGKNIDVKQIEMNMK